MVKNRGKVRGGCNMYARFFLVLKPTGMVGEEVEELGDRLGQEFGFPRGYSTGTWYTNSGDPCRSSEITYPIDTRAQFARLPAMIRKAQSLGWQVGCQLWDVGADAPDGREEGLGSVWLTPQTAHVFWRELALAQAYYRE